MPEVRVDLRCINRLMRWMMQGERHVREVEESFSKASTIVTGASNTVDVLGDLEVGHAQAERRGGWRRGG
jgi:hypothetical protein